MKKLLIAALLFTFSSSIAAADVEHGVTDKGYDYIIISNDIKEGDSETFISILNQYPKIKGIFLDSTGGSVYEGMMIASTVFDKRIDTFILNEKKCLSICAPIFLSGKNKFIQQNAYLGVHPAYDTRTNEKAYEANALIAWYFGSLGYDIGLVEMWISAEPDTMNFINAEINQKLNLGIISID